ncbi:MAG: corrinoid protein [Alphaproteobacteria bacterium]|nr:corrinoid protein [Alphaproteobacteria bacterium]
MELLKQLSEALQQGNHELAADLTRQAIEQSTPPASILDDGLIAGMDVVGERFRRHEIFLPEVLMAAKAMYSGLELLKPLLIKDGIPSQGKIVIGSVQGDLHDIGKNLVGMMLEGAGFTVVNLGVDVPPEKFLEAVHEHHPDVIGMSALLTTTMPNMGKTIQLLRKEGWNGHIMIGGAPVNQEFADAIGADGFAADAPGAVELARRMIGAA